MEEQRLQFLYLSIQDIQSTIRAIDTKVGFLLIFLSIPVSSLGKIYIALHSLYKSHNSTAWQVFFFFYLIIFFLSWVLSFLASFKALTSFHNPREHVISAPENGGSFYCGGLFNPRFEDAFINRKGLKSGCSIDDLIKKQPQDINQIVAELIFEQMKLVYIRDLKIFRQNWAYRFALIWLTVGFVGEMASLIFGRA